MLHFLSLKRRVFYYLIINLSTRRSLLGDVYRLGNAKSNFSTSLSCKPSLLRTETLDTTQDMPIETKNINVICPYLAGTKRS